jgi:endonuclease/exonuclease/phosphatase family metal-dependent hydrolase
VKTNVVRFAAILGCFFVCLAAPRVEAQSNVIVRVLASNLTSGSGQRYETPGLSILNGLNPDVVAMQEFNVSNSFGINTPAALSNMVATTFGTNFVYYRESGYAIPNGIISRYPMLTNGSWVDSDTGVNDRGFAWAKIDVPGTNDLYVVSVHLKASNSGSDVTRRTAQAGEIKALIGTNFPANAWIIVAGDMNIYDETEGAVATFATFLSDTPVPEDQNGDQDTNASRGERYDRVLMSFSLTKTLIPLVMPSHTYPNGLVFDSRVYTNLTDVPPVVIGDSGADQMQHMAVVRDFEITLAAAPSALPPVLTNITIVAEHFLFQVMGSVGSNYIVQATTSLTTPNWVSLQTNPAPFTFAEPNVFAFPQRFYRGLVAP